MQSQSIRLQVEIILRRRIWKIFHCSLPHIMFNDLVLTGKFWTYPADLNVQAQNRLQFIIRQMQVAENVTDELKKQNQMAWIQAVNNIYNRAEEIVIHELVLQ